MSGTADFLYPMIDGDETDVPALLADLARSATEKQAISAAATAEALERWTSTLTEVAAATAGRVAGGGQLFTMGNGGSATDADGVAALFAAPPDGTGVPARSLVADVAVITALANDIGYAEVFARQLGAHATARDVVLGFSTSGNSENLLRGFAAARRLGLLTVGFAGGDGGTMATSADLDHVVVVTATSIHRIQEAQSALAYALWRAVQGRLDQGRHETTAATGGAS